MPYPRIAGRPVWRLQEPVPMPSPRRLQQHKRLETHDACRSSRQGAELLKIGEKLRIGFGNAGGVLDDHARNSQSNQGHAHGHAMIIVSRDSMATQGTWHENQTI